jgi:hypothetical protein
MRYAPTICQCQRGEEGKPSTEAGANDKEAQFHQGVPVHAAWQEYAAAMRQIQF